jgi:hypothetical protein
MDYTKLDASLASALAQATTEDEPSITVSVRTRYPVGPREAEELKAAGISSAPAGKRGFTATLAPGDVARLTDQPWVQSVKLAQRMRLLENE